MPGRGLETLLAEIAGFPDGKHDDQVDALSYVAAYHAKVIYEARRWGLKLGRFRPRRPRFKSSRPNRAIRSSTNGDDRVRADAQSAKRGIARDLTTPAMAIGSNPLSSTSASSTRPGTK
jgi:hypothetical protein